MEGLIEKYLTEIESALGVLIFELFLLLLFFIILVCQMLMKLDELNKKIDSLTKQQIDEVEEKQDSERQTADEIGGKKSEV